MTDPNKVVKNPLFNVAVTGSTFEDFSQHAVLLPVEKKPLTHATSVPPKPPQTIERISETINTVADVHKEQQQKYCQEYNQEITSDQAIHQQQIDLHEQYQPQQEEINYPSVFSSFSNILKLGGNSQKVQDLDVAVPPPAGIESLINQPPTYVDPVPLFPSSGSNICLNNPPPPPPPLLLQPQGPVNLFRCSRLKRPVYAQIPGLSTNSPQTNSSQNLPIHSPPQIDQFIPPTVSPSPLLLEEFNPIVPSTSVEYFKTNLPNLNQTNSSILPELNTNNQSNLFGNRTLGGVQLPGMAGIPTNEFSTGLPSGVTTNGETLPSSSTSGNQIYRPVYQHWFYKHVIEGKHIWKPFSMLDSFALDEAFMSNDLDPDKVVATDGGRYDVNILRRQRIPVYWKGDSTEVRRCSWFHKGNTDGRYVPYEENIANQLEDEFKLAFEMNEWHRKVELPTGETVVFHAADVLVLFPPTQSPDNWSSTPNQTRPRIVKRGMDEFHIDEGEPTKVDHLLFMVHGIGSVCDLKFRSVEEVVDEFRNISLQLIQSHYRSSCEQALVNRIEILPISWHEELHSEETGIDKQLKSITLDSIPRLRDFTNDTLLDILFYTSPIYCQTIVSAVGNQMNKTYQLFKQRNPDFNGGVSLGGHSLGSLILFDLLCHQHPAIENDETPNDGEDTVAPLTGTKPPPPRQRRFSRRISYMMGSVGTGQPQIIYPHLDFQPKIFFALGSPIGMFVTVRGLDNLGEKFALPTCPGFFNIFHPYDPVAYRVESLINPEAAKLKPVLIPHHKGRKRMHLELKETMARVGADLKQKVIDSMKSTWNSFYQLAMFHRQDQPSLEEEVDKALKKHLDEEVDEAEELLEEQQTDLSLGVLNQGRRIDYVLQEAPLEFFNEYIFALTSHVCYWESQDTILIIIKEIYGSMNMTTDDKVPQQTMTIERPPPSPTYSSKSPANQAKTPIGIDPTCPIKQNFNIGPPPASGFVKKT